MFRVDAREFLGRAALERALIVAQEHALGGGRVLFAIDGDQNTARLRVDALGFSYVLVLAPTGSEEDAKTVLAAAAEHGVQSIVVDGRRFHAAYLATLSSNVFTAVQASNRSHPLPVQMVINGRFAADERFYTCPTGSRLLLGPQYQVVPAALTDWPHSERRSSQIAATRIFVGSSDDHSSARILDALPPPASAAILCLQGSLDCPILNHSARAACARGYVVEQVSQDTQAETLLLCDAALVTRDAMSPLISFLGIPCLTMSLDGDDLRETERLAEDGANMLLAPLRALGGAGLERAVEQFLCDDSLRRRIGNRLSSLVDGRGASRILEAISEANTPHLSLLKAA